VNETLQAVRYLVLYPLITVTAALWTALLWARWRRLGLATDFWSAQIGAAIGLWALLSIVGLWLASQGGFGASTGLLVTFGALAAVSYTHSDAADDAVRGDLGGTRSMKKNNTC